MSYVTRTQLNQQTARVLDRVQAGQDVTITDRGRPIARVTPIAADRRTERIATGALRSGTQRGIPAIKTPIRGWSTQQMLEDMRGERS